MTNVPDSTLSFADEKTSGPRLLRGPYLVLAMEAHRPLAPSARWFLNDNDKVVIGRAKRRRYEQKPADGKNTLRIAVPDGWMSSTHATLVRQGASWVVCDDGSKNGTFVGETRIDSHTLQDGDLFAAGNTLFLFYAEGERHIAAPAHVEIDGTRVDLGDLATLNPELARAFDELRKVARSSVPVITYGESGSGKEVVARGLHRLSSRAGDFIAINCGALPENLIESELFGYRKGAFSGATEDRKGLVRAADGGTLFLDEIAELPAGSQTKLLRVLQEGEVVPIGATQPVKVDVRVVAATHQDLSERVDTKSFRKDLYARLSGFEFQLPPLRERLEDLGFIVAALLDRADADKDVKIERAAARRLFHYDWPLNVRELDQALNAALALAEGGPIAVEHLPRAVRDAVDASVTTPGKDAELRAGVVAALKKHNGNVSAAARELGKARVQIRRWCKRLGIDPSTFRA